MLEYILYGESPLSFADAKEGASVKISARGSVAESASLICFFIGMFSSRISAKCVWKGQCLLLGGPLRQAELTSLESLSSRRTKSKSDFKLPFLRYQLIHIIAMQPYKIDGRFPELKVSAFFVFPICANFVLSFLFIQSFIPCFCSQFPLCIF